MVRTISYTHRAAALESGMSPLIGDAMLVWDEHDVLSEHKGEVLALILDRLVERLPAEECDAVRTAVMAQLSLRDAALELGWLLGSGEPDHKRVSRRAAAGVERLRGWMASAPWMGTFLAGRVDPSGL